MGRKLEALTRNLTENQIALTVKDSAHQVWLAGLGAYAMAQDEGGRMFEALVKEGEVLETRTIKFTDAKIAFLTEKAAGSWDRIEREFESRVSRALGRLGVPNKKDVATLTRRVTELTEAVESLSERQRVQRQVVAPVSDASANR
mgnify:CR=1 FL=1